MRLQPGKLPHSLLKRMIRYSGARDSQVLLGPRIGEDAAVIDLGDRCLILKTDPITYAINEIGWYAVHINANDVATMGARPCWFQASLLLPTNMSEKEIEEIFRQIDRACKELDIALAGGHTEMNPWIDRPIVVGDMHGICRKSELVLSSGAKEEDEIILTKGAGIEGTAILAREKRKQLSEKFSRAFLKRAENYLYYPGISILPEAALGVKFGANSMHDPTEGGVAVGLYEIAMAAEKGVLVDREKIKVRKETESLCEFFGIDPLGLLGSGALLLTLPENNVDQYLAKLAKMGIEASVIGKITRKSDGMKILEEGKKRALKYSQKDEILRVL